MKTCRRVQLERKMSDEKRMYERVLIEQMPKRNRSDEQGHRGIGPLYRKNEIVFQCTYRGEKKGNEITMEFNWAERTCKNDCLVPGNGER